MTKPHVSACYPATPCSACNTPLVASTERPVKWAMLQGLNINGGGGACGEIKLRLREGRDAATLLPYDCVLGTMLHGHIRLPADWSSEQQIAVMSSTPDCPAYCRPACCCGFHKPWRCAARPLAAKGKHPRREPMRESGCAVGAEMAHNVRGPHDAVFYKLLDELKEARRPAAHPFMRQILHPRPPESAHSGRRT